MSAHHLPARRHRVQRTLAKGQSLPTTRPPPPVPPLCLMLQPPAACSPSTGCKIHASQALTLNAPLCVRRPARPPEHPAIRQKGRLAGGWAPRPSQQC